MLAPWQRSTRPGPVRRVCDVNVRASSYWTYPPPAVQLHLRIANHESKPSWTHARTHAVAPRDLSSAPRSADDGTRASRACVSTSLRVNESGATRHDAGSAWLGRRIDTLGRRATPPGLAALCRYTHSGRRVEHNLPTLPALRATSTRRGSRRRRRPSLACARVSIDRSNAALRWCRGLQIAASVRAVLLRHAVL